MQDKKRALPVAAYCDGVYGQKGIYVGVPTIIGAGGVEKIIEFPMDAGETEMFGKSVEAVQGLLAACKEIEPSLA